MSVVVVTVATAAFVVLYPNLSLAAAVGLVVVAFGAWFRVLRGLEGAHPRSVRLVGLAAGALLVVAVVVPPRGSLDLWSYVMDGRIVTVHHASPYTHAPGDFHDSLAALVSRDWRHTRTPYGPAFTAFAALGAALVGNSVLMARLFFQGMAAIAVAAILALLWRRTRDPATVAWVGLNPLVIASVVSGGHNDALIALAILAGALLAMDDRPIAAGTVLGAGALVKLTAVLGLGGVALWVWRRNGRRDARLVAGVSGAVVLLGYLPLGRSALSAMSDSAKGMSRYSAWSLVRDWLILVARHPEIVATVAALTFFIAVALAALLTWSRSHDPDPMTAAGAAAAAFPLASGYVLPWYAIWGLPVLALRRSRSFAWLAAVDGALLLALYEFPDRAAPATDHLLLVRLVTGLTPTALLAVAIAIAVANLRKHRGKKLAQNHRERVTPSP
jgi:hypothetical protein